MAVVYDEMNLDTQSANPAHDTDNQATRLETIERSNDAASSNLGQQNFGQQNYGQQNYGLSRNSTRTRLSSVHSIREETPTSEIGVEAVEAHAGTALAVTMDPELRSVLGEVLPNSTLAFADSLAQVLTKPVPKNLAVLVVEESLSR